MTNSTLSNTLSPLSKEHVDGLNFASRIRKGLHLHVKLERLREYTLWYWTEHIRPHFFQEEKMLMPWLPAGHALLTRVKDEHHYIRELVLAIDEEAENRTLALLADLIEDHIEFEENILFPYLAGILDQDLVDKIGQMIDKHPLKQIEWKDRFWEE
jgi:iron-sulfur cluster repair protein YtfE (RIC family)